MENLTVAQLREKAKELGIKGVSGMKKDELIKLLSEKPEEEPKKQLFDIAVFLLICFLSKFVSNPRE